jgi:hypothetical protein
MSDAPRRVDWREPITAAMCAAAGLVALSWPTAIHPTEWIIGASHNDGNAILWGLDHVARALADGALPKLHTTALLFPDGGTMLVSNLAEVILLAPVTLSLGAVAAFNVWTLLHHALSAGAAMWCARRHGASRLGATMVATAFSFSPAMAATSFNQNPDVTAWYWLPLAAGLAWKAPHRRTLVAAGLATGMAIWCNPYGGVMTATAVTLLMARQRWSRWIWALLPATIIGGLGVVLYHHGATVADSMTEKALRNNPLHGVALWRDLIDPNPNLLQQDSTWSAAQYANYGYLGISLLLVGLTGLVAQKNRVWLAILSASVLLAVGPGAGPLSPVVWLEQWTPLGRLHLGHRYTVLGIFALSMGAALWSRAWRPRWQALMLFIVSVDLLSPVIRFDLYRPSAPFQDGACALLASLEPGAVFDVPGERGEQWLFAASCHQRPIAAGLNRALSKQLRHSLQSAVPQDRPKLLRAEGFRYLVSHARSPRRELEHFPELTRLSAHCEVARNRAGVRVFDLDRCEEIP